MVLSRYSQTPRGHLDTDVDRVVVGDKASGKRVGEIYHTIQARWRPKRPNERMEHKTGAAAEPGRSAIRKDDLMTWYERVPKVELHVHLESAIPHAALFALIRKYGGNPSVPDVTALAKRFEYRDFPQFVEAWSWKNQFLREYEDFTYIAELTA